MIRHDIGQLAVAQDGKRIGIVTPSETFCVRVQRRLMFLCLITAFTFAYTSDYGNNQKQH